MMYNRPLNMACYYQSCRESLKDIRQMKNHSYSYNVLRRPSSSLITLNTFRQISHK